MEKIKILVAQHKNAVVYSNNVYIPIHVGKAISNIDLGIIGDDTGDNISHLNPYYCELTAQYWAWKNMRDIDYIGLCHYRRYFKKEIMNENIDALMDGYDIILCKRIVLNCSVIDYLSNLLTNEDVLLFYLFMRDKASNTKSVDYFYRNNNKFSPCNMFVCRKELFDMYCEWQFGILDKIYTILPKSPYSREQRIIGYLAETLLSFYAYTHNLRVREIPIIPMIGNQNEYFKRSLLGNMMKNFIFNISPKFRVRLDILSGLERDGYIEMISRI